MKEFSIPMALADYIPVILFLLATNIISKDLKHAMNKVIFIIFEFGRYLVFIAGLLKATYKLIYALGIGNYEWLSNQFFSNQAIGFLLVGITLTIAVVKPQMNKTYALLPTMALVGIMIIGLGAMDAALAYLASKLKKKSSLVCFIISFFLLLAMGYLSTKNFDKAYMNWLAQGINIIGQLLLFIGAKGLHKAGLKDYPVA